MKLLNENIENVPVQKLALHPKNPRKGDISLIQEMIESNGFYGVIVAQKSTGHILVGNHRYQAAVKAGASEVPVAWVDCSDEEAVKIMLSDNKASDEGKYDEGLLAELLSQVNLAGTGYSEDDFNTLKQLEVKATKQLEIIEWESGKLTLRTKMVFDVRPEDSVKIRKFLKSVDHAIEIKEDLHD